MIEGFRVHDLAVHVDERGSFTELLRSDWQEFLGKDKIMQFNLSYSFPGVVRAWHRHLKGQNDYFMVIEGSIKVCAYDERENSPTFGEVDEVVISPERMRVVRVPGICWHGYKAVSSYPVKVLYGVTRLYNYKQPDELRRPWDDPKIVPKAVNGKTDDPRVGEIWDWYRSPNK